MSENEPRPAEEPYGGQAPTNPYGQPVPPPAGPSANPISDHGAQPPPHEPGRQSAEEHTGGSSAASWDSPQASYPPPHGQPAPYGTDPYGGGAYGTGQYGAYGMPAGRGDQRPGTVTAAGWITIVVSALTAAAFLFITVIAVVAKGPMIDEMRRQPGFDDVDIDPGSVVGVVVAVFIVLTLWSIIGVALGVAVLRRSNVGRVLLVISSVVVALFSLLGIGSGVTVITLAASVGVIILLFVGGANDWFSRRSTASPYGDSPYGGGDQPYGGTYQR